MQIVGYDTSEPGVLVSHASRGSDSDIRGPADATGNGAGIADPDAPTEVAFVPLEPGTDLEYALGDRHCAGTLTDSGHVPCAEPTAPQCPQHRSTWVCAKCTGTCLKDEMDCVEPHVVYLAAFAPDTFKVGVTKEWRLETRLREQGADRGARVTTVPDGRIAREREAEIAGTVPDRVRVPAKRAGLHRSVDVDAWADLLSSYDVADSDRYTFDYGLDLRDRPVAETIGAGTVRGAKGRLVVLDRAGTTYAVDLRNLVGHRVTQGTTSRDLQASLSAWE
ncbi:hypothetical protein GCM10008995_20590 [Halobellus salinus]|uniref:DUF2797 domain-containing protein n=1 Tax=Halobellus salinus TaxID=931585 RepID=A0A830EHH0_9EURY|nr:DUF2797 domain-containing protein [Halobellus salinus]GGJ10642.1 hypothetical protein GCM10008995_20590 [Halobellus salinus]SMP10076.1 Protein of unknown function [Halobellus salinus]